MDCNTLVSVFFIFSSLQIYLFLLWNIYFFFVLIELNLNGYMSIPSSRFREYTKKEWGLELLICTGN